MGKRMNDEEFFKKFKKKCPWHNRMTTNLCEAQKTFNQCRKVNCAPFFWAINMTVRCIETK